MKRFIILLIVLVPMMLQAQSNTSTLKDIDGNIYLTITIGKQIWMAENLRTTRYNDGSTIPNVIDSIAWSNLSTDGWCSYNNISENDTKYGKLYNWDAVNSGKLAPSGWHIPTDTEWADLNSYIMDNLGTSTSVGKSLASSANWALFYKEGTIGNELTQNNNTGFNALPGGCRFSYGAFSGIDIHGVWWCIPQDFIYGTWARHLYFNDNKLCSIKYFPIGDGMSVRCIKD